MRGQELKGHLDLLLLTVLADRPLHGYAVIEELRARSGDAFDLPEGTVYPALHRLQAAGCLDSEWAVVDGRRRRTYRLTEKGRHELVDRRRRWDEFADAITATLGGTPWPVTS